MLALVQRMSRLRVVGLVLACVPVAACTSDQPAAPPPPESAVTTPRPAPPAGKAAPAARTKYQAVGNKSAPD